MEKSQFAYGVSLAAIAVTMWGAPAQALNVAAAPANAGFQRGGGGHHHHNGGGGGGSGDRPLTYCALSSGGCGNSFHADCMAAWAAAKRRSGGGSVVGQAQGAGYIIAASRPARSGGS